MRHIAPICGVLPSLNKIYIKNGARGKKMNYDNFVFYGSWRETLEGFREEFGDDYAKEALWNLMLMATAGDIETKRNSIIGFINGAVMPNINKAKDRYAAAIENGKKGGRPKIKLNEQEVLAKKKELKTWKATAQYFGISEQSLKNYRNVWENEKNEKNPKNLDIDIDIDIEKDIEKENDNDNDNVKENEMESESEMENEKKKLVFLDEDEMDFFRFEKSCFIREGYKDAEAEEMAYSLVLESRESAQE